MEDKKNYDKIGGWLILCAVGLLLYPVQTAVTLFTKIVPALSQNNWSTLTSPASASYHPLWGPLLIMELVGNVCFLVLSISVILFFLKRRKFVPKLAIVFMTLNLAFVAVDNAEAALLALERNSPPEGHARWTLRLLADELVKLGYVDSISHETVRRALNKARSNRS